MHGSAKRNAAGEWTLSQFPPTVAVAYGANPSESFDDVEGPYAQYRVLCEVDESIGDESLLVEESDDDVVNTVPAT